MSATIGPCPAFMTCQGCPALKREWWKEHLDNDETDSGTFNQCKAADDRTIDGPYGSPHPHVPKWCPATSDGADLEAAREDEQTLDWDVSLAETLYYAQGYEVVRTVGGAWNSYSPDGENLAHCVSLDDGKAAAEEHWRAALRRREDETGSNGGGE